MGRRLSFLAILAICVCGTFSIPQEADPICPNDICPEYEEDLPIDCEWKEWGECSGTCGEGVQARDFYKSLNGGLCNLDFGTSSRKCNNTTPCPIDCKWGQWETCSTTCGNGISKRVIEQQAQHGGKQCNLPRFTKKCNLKPCSVDCKWDQWGPCSTKCGPGNQNRVIEQQAQHGGRDCRGSSVKGCNLKQCPIDCKWSQWGPCDSTCGQGSQTRFKEQQAEHDGRKCEGSNIKSCNPKPCPFDCVWSQWDTCSKTCGPGIQRRAVRLEARNGGETCIGKKIKDCNQRSCPIDCQWSQWGICSSNCGDGKQERTVEIEARYGGEECQGEKERNCNEGSCGETIPLTVDYKICKHVDDNPQAYQVPHPDDCTKFYSCQNLGWRGGYIAHLMDCPPTTGFDTKLRICNDIRALPRCNKGNTSFSPPSSLDTPI